MRYLAVGAVVAVVGMLVAACGGGANTTAPSKHKSVSPARTTITTTGSRNAAPATTTSAPTTPTSPAPVTTTTTGPPPLGSYRTQKFIRQLLNGTNPFSSISWRSAPLSGGTPRLLGLSGPCNFEIIGPSWGPTQATVSCVISGTTTSQENDELQLFHDVIWSFAPQSASGWFDSQVESASQGSMVQDISTTQTYGTITLGCIVSSSSLGNVVELTVSPS
jgi:hypothetical protein